MEKREAIWGILFVSLALLVNEVMLSAIFSVTLGELNTLTAISVALLGLSGSGIVFYLFPKLRAERGFASGYWMLSLFVASTAVCIAVIMNLPISHGDFVYDSSVQASAWKIVSYLCAMMPFFAGGLCLNKIISSAPRNIGSLYFADLAGASLGCLASIFLLRPFGAPWAVIASCVPAAVIVLRATLKRRAPRACGAVCLGVPIGLLALNLLYPVMAIKKIYSLGEVNSPRYESVAITPDQLDYEEWALDAWTVIRKDSVPQQWQNFSGWGLSRNYSGPLPRIKLINYNSRFSTYATEFDGKFDQLGAWLDSDLISLQYLLGREFHHVLNIGAGGGREVLNALNHGAGSVTAVEISEVTVDRLMKGSLRAFTGDLFGNPKVHAVVDEGRSFVERYDRKYDLLDFAIVGGTNVEKMDLIRIDDLFTLEALRSYVGHLNPDGVFSYSMYGTRLEIMTELAGGRELREIPYIPALKTLTGLRSALQSVDPSARFADHVLVAAVSGVIDRDYDLVHIIFSRSPFTPKERAAYAKAIRNLAFRSYFPAERTTEGNLYERVATADAVDALQKELPFSIKPTVDDRPFQHSIKGDRPLQSLVLLLRGNPIVASGLLLFLIGVLFLVAPTSLQGMMGGKAPASPPWPMMIYFSIIGAAYMLVEIPALLRLQIYLGRPVVSLGVGLFSFLLASGLGSACTKGFDKAGFLSRLGAGTALVVTYGLLFSLGWEQLFARTIQFPVGVRACIAVAAIFPLAFTMGFFLPIGVRVLSDGAEENIPWAWALNGCFSVLGIFGSRILASGLGFSGVLHIGMLLYPLAWLCLARGLQWPLVTPSRRQPPRIMVAVQ